MVHRYLDRTYKTTFTTTLTTILEVVILKTFLSNSSNSSNSSNNYNYQVNHLFRRKASKYKFLPRGLMSKMKEKRAKWKNVGEDKEGKRIKNLIRKTMKLKLKSINNMDNNTCMALILPIILDNKQDMEILSFIPIHNLWFRDRILIFILNSLFRIIVCLVKNYLSSKT